MNVWMTRKEAKEILQENVRYHKTMVNLEDKKHPGYVPVNREALLKMLETENKYYV